MYKVDNHKFLDVIAKNPNVAFEAFKMNYKGFEIQCYKFGAGRNITLCVPSYPFSGLYYHWLLKNFDYKDQTFITFDIPGWIGYSDDIFKGTRFYMSDIISIGVDLINLINPQEFSILGYSFGGMVALELASIFDSRVLNLTLVSTITDGYLAQSSTTYRAINLVYKLKMPTIMKMVVFLWVKAIRIQSYFRGRLGMEYVGIYEDMFHRTDRRILLDSIYSLFNFNYSDFLRKLNKESVAKIFIANSSQEQSIFFAQGKLMKELCPKADYSLLEGNHISFITNADKPEVKEFMNKVTKV